VSSTVTDDTTFSLKVFAQAYYVAMQKLTGGVDSEFSIRVLNQCRIEVATIAGVVLALDVPAIILSNWRSWGLTREGCLH